jgi:hypothetical protein
MTNYISYSLYGSDEYYVQGAIKNVINNAKVMPEWVNIIYVSQFTIQKFGNLLSEIGCKLVVVPGEDNNISTIWRFFATGLQDAEYILFRDCDSIIGQREKAFVSLWIDSNKALHIIRDHPLHKSNILAGLCGVNNSKVHNLLNAFKNSKLVDMYGIDQWFVNRELFKKYGNDSLVHDSSQSFSLMTDSELDQYEKSDYIGKRLSRENTELISLKNLIEVNSLYKNRKKLIELKRFKSSIAIEVYFRYNNFMFGSKMDLEFEQ